MKKIILPIFIFIVGYTNAQSNQKKIEHNELLKYKVDQNKFQFGWLPEAYLKIPCFRDYTDKNMQTEIIDQKTNSIIYKYSKPKRNGLVIIPGNIKIDKENKTLQINGKITGGWDSVIPFEFEIYIAHRTDTTSNITLSPRNHYGDNYFNGKKIDSTIVVDTVPAFFLSNLKKFEAYRGKDNVGDSKYKEILFDINAIIDEKSVLIFALSSCYAEIFEVGKLLTE